jgi:hypothetical protein
MKINGIALAVLVTAVAALVASIGWAATRTGDGSGWMMARYGSGMMGYASTGRGEPVESLAEARTQAERFAERLDLGVGEVMQFSNNYYAELEEDGRPATEVLVDPTTGAVWLEYGPAMMWNTRFGMMSDFRLRGQAGIMGGGSMMGGMMGSGMMAGGGMMGSTPSGSAAGGDVSAVEAERIAADWLRVAAPGTAAGEAEPFPGYYTVHVLRAGKVNGMLSVNASTGDVWYHGWHGRFLSMAA